MLTVIQRFFSMENQPQPTPATVQRWDIFTAIKNSQVTLALLVTLGTLLGTILNIYVTRLLVPVDQRIAGIESSVDAQEQRTSDLDSKIKELQEKTDTNGRNIVKLLIFLGVQPDK